MARDIRIVNTELQWKDWSGVVRSREGDLMSDGSGTDWDNRIPGSIYIFGSTEYLTYIDRSGSAKRRRIFGVEVEQASESALPRSLYSYGQGLRYIPEPREAFDRPVYEILEGDPPTSSPQNLTLDWGQRINFPPWEGIADWTNQFLDTWDTIEVRFYRNGGLAEAMSFTSTTLTNADTFPNGYYEIGDDMQVDIWYTNQFGAGPTVSEQATIS